MIKEISKKRLITRRNIIVSVFLGVFLAAAFFYNTYLYGLPQSVAYLLPSLSRPQKTDRILVISPHPDDETIASGGYIAEATKRGIPVFIVLVTDGNRHGLKDKRYSEFKKATQILGVKSQNLFFLNYPDFHLETVDAKEVEQKLEKIVSKTQPTLIIAPHPQDQHPDHKVCAQVAFKLAKKHQIKLYQYIVHHRFYPRPRKRNPSLYLLPPIAQLKPNAHWSSFVLSSQSLDKKSEAILQYKTQLRMPFLRALFFSLLRKNELFDVVEF